MRPANKQTKSKGKMKRKQPMYKDEEMKVIIFPSKIFFVEASKRNGKESLQQRKQKKGNSSFRITTQKKVKREGRQGIREFTQW